MNSAERGEQWAADLAAAENATSLSALKPVVLETYRITSEAKRRMWRARDEVERLRRQMNDAETALIAAQRDYESESEHMQMVWQDFRGHIERIPVVE